MDHYVRRPPEEMLGIGRASNSLVPNGTSVAAVDLNGRIEVRPDLLQQAEEFAIHRIDAATAADLATIAGELLSPEVRRDLDHQEAGCVIVNEEIETVSPAPMEVEERFKSAPEVETDPCQIATELLSKTV